MIRQRRTPAAAILGIDSGGTFTDFVLLDGNRLTLLKLPSTPDDPARAILEGTRRLLGARPLDRARTRIAHGTTVPTNALLQRRLGKAAFVTTAGFEDLIEIGRQSRERLYDWNESRPEPLVPRSRRLGLDERVYLDRPARSRRPPSAEDLRSLRRAVVRMKRDGLQAVAVGLLHSWQDPRAELMVERALRGTGIFVTLSHALSSEHREYERFSTAVANACLQPVVAPYLDALESGLGRNGSHGAGRLTVMKSSGLRAASGALSREPVHAVMSGPAGGVIASAAVGRRLRGHALVTFDMGGTSTDVSLVMDGAPLYSDGVRIGGVPLRLPSVAVESIGAGGGSIAWRDAGGALRVGPESAGADPGPACAGRGDRPTVTDAQVVLGRIGAHDLLGGDVTLYPARAKQAVGALARTLGLGLETCALGIVRVANANMVRALRSVVLARGVDPRETVLVCFGGAGGLHAAELAAELGAERIVVPPAPGAFCALGLLLAPEGLDRVGTLLRPASRCSQAFLSSRFEALERAAARSLARSGGSLVRFERRADLRYLGQSHEITVSAARNPVRPFETRYRDLYGSPPPGLAVEIVALRVRACGAALTTFERIEKAARAAPPPRVTTASRPAGKASRVIFAGPAGRPAPRAALIVRREDLRPGREIPGPARILEYSSLTLVPPGWIARTDAAGLLHLRGAARDADRRRP